jgi:predicted deacylase
MLKTINIIGVQPGPRLLITGGVHGDEFEPMAAIRQLAQAIDRHELSGALILIPVVNEAAFNRGQRTAADGLDLARTCPGTIRGTVTQRAAAFLNDAIRTADFYIDLHTGGTTLSIFPLAGYMLHSDADILDRQREMARAFNLPVIWGTDATLDGRSLSVARDARVPAMYVEHGGAAVCSPSAVDAMVTGCLNVLGSLGMLPRPGIPSSRVRWVVEDPRPGSGHLQQSHPAPVGGFFQPTVALGDIIVAGQPIGHVCDPLGEHCEVVTARVSGLVLALRTFPSVALGDSLVVILEI